MRIHEDIGTFSRGHDTEEQVKKVFEELAEVFAENRRLIGVRGHARTVKQDLGSEMADLIVATCNLASMHGFTSDDMSWFIAKANAKNRERGRLQ